jgi:hypothetical protein
MEIKLTHYPNFLRTPFLIVSVLPTIHPIARWITVQPGIPMYSRMSDERIPVNRLGEGSGPPNALTVPADAGHGMFLQFLDVLFSGICWSLGGRSTEGRRSIQLSYGRIDSSNYFTEGKP